MATRKQYPGAAEVLALNANIGAGDATLASSVTPSAQWPSPGNPYVMSIDPGGSEEKVLVTSRAGVTFTITRGYDGTTAVGHNAGVALKVVWDGTSADEANKAATAVLNAVTAKGDIPAGTGSQALGTLAAGANNTVPYADSSQATGWNKGKVTEAMVTPATLTDASIAAANKDGAAGTASLRTLGMGAAQATAGNDARLSNSRAPTGAASGSLAGTYPSPTLAADSVGASQITDGTVGLTEAAAALKADFVTFSQAGTLATGTGKLGFRAPVALTLQHVRMRVNTAPTGATLIVDLNKNATTTFTTQANRPTINAGAFTENATTAPNITAVAAGDVLTVDIDQVGSSVAGADLTVTIYYTLA